MYIRRVVVSRKSLQRATSSMHALYVLLLILSIGTIAAEAKKLCNELSTSKNHSLIMCLHKNSHMHAERQPSSTTFGHFHPPPAPYNEFCKGQSISNADGSKSSVAKGKIITIAQCRQMKDEWVKPDKRSLWDKVRCENWEDPHTYCEMFITSPSGEEWVKFHYCTSQALTYIQVGKEVVTTSAGTWIDTAQTAWTGTKFYGGPLVNVATLGYTYQPSEFDIDFNHHVVIRKHNESCELYDAKRDCCLGRTGSDVHTWECQERGERKSCTPHFPQF